MSGEKKLWRLSIPFRRSPGKEDPPLKVKVGHSGSCVPSVYLSDDSSTNGFVIAPELDDSVRAEATLEESNHTSHVPNLPAVTPFNLSSPNGVDGYPYGLEPIGHQYKSYLDEGCYGTSDVSRDDDLPQRLNSAYEHIRSMPSSALPKVLLSSDPEMLRKQFGVPQHSVLNHPTQSSADLPNPHTSPHEPMSSRLPPAASPGMSQARSPKTLELRMNTDVYPPCLRCYQPSPFQPAQQKYTVTTPMLSEDFPSERSTLRDPWNAHTACTLKPQTSTPDSPKLSKRRTEQATISVPSLPSSREVLGGVLRKPVIDTPPSRNAPRWQDSLPHLRPPSPFRVNIPLHHTWHDRRIDFNSPPEYHSKTVQSYETKTQRISGSTDALASLAWIGTPPRASGFYAADQGRQSASSACLPGRLSAAVVEDDSMPDDVLVDQLEKARRMGGEQGRDTPPWRTSGNAHFHSSSEDPNDPFHTSCLSSFAPTPDQLAKSCDVQLPSPLILKDTALDPDDAAVWQAARKALLCIREIVRTERKYQDALKMLLNAQTATPPPTSMTPYVSALVRASEILLEHLIEDPSAWGVSTAFVTSEDELETTMVSWCAVAGRFFTDKNDPRSSGLTGKWRLRKSRMSSSSTSSSLAEQTSISLSPQLPPMVSTISPTDKIKEQMEAEHCTTEYARTMQERKTTSVFLQGPESKNCQPPSRKLSVRDLAIQPIQRVMRYVLLYRDLLNCTPLTSPSRLLVERALEAATRIANHCDRAQRNPAFCHVS